MSIRVRWRDRLGHRASAHAAIRLRGDVAVLPRGVEAALLDDSFDSRVEGGVRVGEVGHREAPVEQRIPATADLPGRFVVAELGEIGVQHRVAADLVACGVDGLQLRQGQVAAVDPDVPRDRVERPHHPVRLERRERVGVLIFIAIVKGERDNEVRRGGSRGRERAEDASEDQGGERNAERQEPGASVCVGHHGNTLQRTPYGSIGPARSGPAREGGRLRPSWYGAPAPTFLTCLSGRASHNLEIIYI